MALGKRKLKYVLSIDSNGYAHGWLLKMFIKVGERTPRAAVENKRGSLSKMRLLIQSWRYTKTTLTTQAKRNAFLAQIVSHRFYHLVNISA